MNYFRIPFIPFCVIATVLATFVAPIIWIIDNAFDNENIPIKEFYKEAFYPLEWCFE